MSDFLLQFRIEKKKLKKLLKDLDDFDTLENKEGLSYLILKLQDLNFELNQAIDQMYIEENQEQREEEVVTILNNRENNNSILPLFMNMYMN